MAGTVAHDSEEADMAHSLTHQLEHCLLKTGQPYNSEGTETISLRDRHTSFIC